MPSPEGELIPTRATLLQRLKDWQDQSSWQEFFDTYWKLIYGVARGAGMTDAEAQDVVQETVICLTKKIQGFTYDPAQGSFKGWLKRMTRWRIADFMRRKQYQHQGRRLPKEEPLGTSLAMELEDPATAGVEKVWDEEWENNLLEVALGKIRQQVSPKLYQMFFYHVCKKLPAKQVAERLGVKLAEVYFAKYRVSSLMKKEIRSLETRFA